MEVLEIQGAAALHGEITISGAKNAVLPILAGCCLCHGTCVLENCPGIADVERTLDILRVLGARVERSGTTLAVQTDGLTGSAVPRELAGKLRSSVLFSGALLARAGEAGVPLPGGCPLGKRPIDLHLWALERLGAELKEENGVLRLRWRQRRAARIEFPIVSVGATENAMLAALACPGQTVLKNAAAEPEVAELAAFLQSAGAEIEGAGTREIHICGGRPLRGVIWTVRPDRIETATFLCAVAGCGGDVLLRRADERQLLAVTELLRGCGCEIQTEQDALRIRRNGRLRHAECVRTAPWPGFPTDVQALWVAAMLRADGVSCVEETMFENRFHHVPELRKLGARITQTEHTAVVYGVERLQGARLRAHDLRGGAALALAAMQSEGKSELFGLRHIDRGYEAFEEKYRALGADIRRTSVG